MCIRDRYIIIDAEKDTFIIHPYTDNVPDLDTNKGSGTISFDETSGIYKMCIRDRTGG